MIHFPAFETMAVSPAHTDEPVLLVRLNRPDVANAFNPAMVAELTVVWQTLADNPDAYRCVVLTGTGEKAFCAGADLKARQGITTETWLAQHHRLEAMMLAMNRCPVPVLTAVNGAAFGGGLELILAGDFAYAAPHARFALPEVTRGIIPGAGGTQWLPRITGLSRAREIILTGEAFTAEDALRWGILNRIVPSENLLNETLQTAARICRNAPVAIRAARQAMRQIADTFESGYAREVSAYQTTVSTADRLEGIAAFNEKRPPVFLGR
ncbi:MAG: enoyl-CoA hydratase/isomerase family protein [Candidatus Melainabacteria bacterium]